MLRRRVTLALLSLLVGMTLLLRGLLWLADVWVEDAGLQDLLEHEMSALADSPQSAWPQSAALRYFRPAQEGSSQLPEPLRGLRPGLHEDVIVGGQPWRVLVRDVHPGDRAYLAYLVAFVEQREDTLAAMATGGMMVLLLGAWALARSIAARALEPLDRLVGQIRMLDPSRGGQRLALTSPPSELDIIVDALNGHLQQLERLVERERAFASAASHELRTPLAVIQGSAEMLHPATESERRALERLDRAVQEITEQIHAILALSPSREAPAATELRLEDWLQATAGAMLSSGAFAGKVEWDCVPARLVAPPGAARIVFTNLLQNAVRAAPGGLIRVQVRPGCVTVEDEGAGIAAEVLPRVFEPGFRGREGGSGMGLYIARSLAERYGWTLELANREGRGARATWRFDSYT